jgi:hypothetical protein
MRVCSPRYYAPRTQLLITGDVTSVRFSFAFFVVKTCYYRQLTCVKGWVSLGSYGRSGEPEVAFFPALPAQPLIVTWIEFKV